MRWNVFQLCAVLCGLWSTAGCAGPTALISDGKMRARAGDFDGAARVFDRAAAKSKDPGVRVEALTLAAEALEQRRDLTAAQARLEAAIAPDIAGASEPALYRLGRLLETTDRPRALNLYYRAASGAERHRHSGFPYREATMRILVMSQQQ